MVLRIGIILALIAISGSNGQESCTTVSGGRGNCISIVDCAPLFAILKESANLPSAQTEVLKKARCGIVGTTPKVCCASNEPPEVSPPRYGGSGGQVPSLPDVSRHPNLRLINDKACGQTTDVKIIQGNKTAVLEFPWMALIGYKVNGKGLDFQCGGTLINKRWVLTAAHCVSGIREELELSTVRLGEHDLDKEQDCDEQEPGAPTTCADKYQDFSIEKFVAHGSYRPSAQGDDIALIKLNRDAEIVRSNNVRPICLPIGNVAELEAPKAIATGWGRTEWGVRSFDLLKVALDIMSNPECAKVFESNWVPITHKQLCAGGKMRKDSCAGDSGGPLQYPGTKFASGVPKMVQYGIVSFGTKACGVEGYPGVYTRVAYYVDWILDNITP